MQCYSKCKCHIEIESDSTDVAVSSNLSSLDFHLFHFFNSSQWLQQVKDTEKSQDSNENHFFL